MYEKVNKYHPDKVADRIAGAIVDLAYNKANGGWFHSNPRIAVEVLLGHGAANIIVETSLGRQELPVSAIEKVAASVQDGLNMNVKVVPQDFYLSENQRHSVRVGDNGIFCGYPVNGEQKALAALCREITERFPSDGKYILDDGNLVVCQSNADLGDILDFLKVFRLEYCDFDSTTINPLGYWTGGSDVDCGATNRKLGSDMGDAVTGGGLHGKDLSKADVSVNIACHIRAQQCGQRVVACTAIGDESIRFRYDDGRSEQQPFADIVEQAREYIYKTYGSFQHFAANGLIM